MARKIKADGQVAVRKLRGLQHEILVAAVSCDETHEVLGLLCRRIEELETGAACSSLGIDAGRLIRPLAAPIHEVKMKGSR